MLLIINNNVECYKELENCFKTFAQFLILNRRLWKRNWRKIENSYKNMNEEIENTFLKEEAPSTHPSSLRNLVQSWIKSN